MLLQNITSTLYNLRNMSEVQYNITKFITRITKIEELLKNIYFTKIKKIKMNYKHSNIIKAKTIHMIMKDTAHDYTPINKLF